MVGVLFRKKIQKESYDKETMRPVLKCSICNGEQVAGFQNIHTGEIHEIMFVRGEKDLEEFKKKYDIDSITKVY
jgi:hypothetical protein